jgi:hypothetical protein
MAQEASSENTKDWQAMRNYVDTRLSIIALENFGETIRPLKTSDKSMRLYELLVLLRTITEKEQFNEILDELEKSITYIRKRVQEE